MRYAPKRDYQPPIAEKKCVGREHHPPITIDENTHLDYDERRQTYVHREQGNFSWLCEQLFGGPEIL